jgi:exonuclease I
MYAPKPIFRFIGEDTIEKLIIQLRERNYDDALKLITEEEWKDYCNYGIQQFVDPCDYLSCVAQETSNDKDLRLFRYLRLHQEADAEVNH